MKFLKDRNLIIIAIVLVLLVGGFYLTNNKDSQKKEETKKEDQVNLKDNENNSTENSKSEVTVKGVVSVEPVSNASLSKAPTQVVLKLDKEITAGSEIKVVSDKGVDVVTAGNKLTSDLKSLTAPVKIEVAGTYNVSYKLNWLVGGSSEGSYKFSVK